MSDSLLNKRTASAHPCAPAVGRGDFKKLEPRGRSTADNKEYEVTPSASPKLPLVAISRRQLLIFLKR